jgi:hypothetical protein
MFFLNNQKTKQAKAQEQSWRFEKNCILGMRDVNVSNHYEQQKLFLKLQFRFLCARTKRGVAWTQFCACNQTQLNKPWLIDCTGTLVINDGNHSSR